MFVKRLTLIQDLLVKKFNQETVVKVLERLIKNEKFFCKILISMILLMLKNNSADQKGTDSTFKEQALGLIKKILKKKAWELLAAQQKEAGKPNVVSDDWLCIKRGLMIYFGNKLNWSKDVYRVWRDYITE